MPDSSSPRLDHCHHPLVRDLAWLLEAPDLVSMPWPGRPAPATLGFGDPACLAAWLDDLEAYPDRLEARVSDALSGRMGLYHERLWQFLLAEAPGTELLAHNLRIHRDKQTLGELDLLYRHTGEAEVIHLEVAIKYYLGLAEGPGEADDQARWIGPGGADSLAGKREHLHRRQLRLSELPEAREVIQALRLADAVGADRPLAIRRQVAIPGVLFYPWHADLPRPRDAGAHHLRGIWLAWSSWRDFRDGLAAGTRGAWLNKPHWLALPRAEALLPLRALEARLAQHFLQPAAPVQVVLWHGDAGWQRVFVVADDWPRQIPLPPFGRQPEGPEPADVVP